jgi:CRISPR system Cascade subunit CasD
MDVLVLRLDAPLMSFGGSAVDRIGVIEEFPTLSMVTGLLANALGYEHPDARRTQRLQERLRVASRRDRSGSITRDFQTVDLGQEFLQEGGWTTQGAPEGREGGSSRTTHIRQRFYIADAVFTIVVSLEPPGEEPGLAHLESALQEPTRPLFLGRKPCLPAAPLVVGRSQAPSLRDALAAAERIGNRGDQGALAAWWPAEEGGDDDQSRLLAVTDERDWSNQLHGGHRLLRHGTVSPPEVRE